MFFSFQKNVVSEGLKTQYGSHKECLPRYEIEDFKSRLEQFGKILL